jgi:hypothetical protein
VLSQEHCHILKESKREISMYYFKMNDDDICSNSSSDVVDVTVRSCHLALFAGLGFRFNIINSLASSRSGQIFIS